MCQGSSGINAEYGRNFCFTENSMSRPLKIDFHTHILPREIPNFEEKYEGEWISIVPTENGKTKMMKGGRLFRVVEKNCFDIEQRLKEMDEYGVDVQVLCTVPVMFNYNHPAEACLELSRYLNDDIAASVNEYPHRFVGLGTVPMQSPDLAIQELRRCVQELGMVGIQIGSHVNDWNLNEPTLFPIFEECAREAVVSTQSTGGIFVLQRIQCLDHSRLTFTHTFFPEKYPISRRSMKVSG
eukprot:TRINITY_DN2526_c0_g1_i1.p1 TRINITY_DN2526_c0_g1~~TRINITY_DN2526_c0_g1_i1.p1  ORF type:complete len:240 (-),score=54.25 TRINITY_DN2526_c0_g1_i1:624-1343(-)